MSNDKRRILDSFFKSKEQKQADKEQRIRNAAMAKIKKLDEQKKKIDEEIIKMGKYIIKDGKIQTAEEQGKAQPKPQANPFEEVPIPVPPQQYRTHEIKKELPVIEEDSLPPVRQGPPMPRAQAPPRYVEPQEVPQHPRPTQHHEARHTQQRRYEEPRPMVAPPEEVPPVEVYGEQEEVQMVPVTLKLVNGEMFEFTVAEVEMDNFLKSLAQKMKTEEAVQLGKVIINAKHIAFLIYE